MKSALLFIPLFSLAFLPSCQTAGEKPSTTMEMPPYKGSAAFEKMKSLVGKWKGDTCVGSMVTEFRLIAGGSVIEERFAAGTPMEMLSTYYDVNGKLMMTHYCALRNQPRMALIKSTPNSLTFDLVPTTGLNTAKDQHMHGATYTFVDNDRLKVTGVSWKNGKPDANCGTCEYKRL
jgi:hypothetical protein